MKYLLANRHKLSIVYTATLFSGLNDVDLTRDRRVNIPESGFFTLNVHQANRTQSMAVHRMLGVKT